MPIERALRLVARPSRPWLCFAACLPLHRFLARKTLSHLRPLDAGRRRLVDCLTVDSAAHRLYITHGARVDVVDTQSGKLVGSIANLQGTHGVALDDAGKFGYISDGRGNAVVVFDRATLAVVATIPAGSNPTKSSSSRPPRPSGPSTATATHHRDRRRKKEGWWPAFLFPAGPSSPRRWQGNGLRQYRGQGELVRLDAKALKLTADWPLTGCEEPGGLAFDIAGGRLFSAAITRR